MPSDSEVHVECSRNLDPSGDTIIYGLGAITFWGAQTYMYVNIVHFFVCIVVVIIYCTLPVNKNLYNRLVLRHNVSLLILGGILTLLGYCELFHCSLGSVGTRLLWLNLQYFTNATVFWLNVVCFDMTLVITRFCWIPAIGNRDDEERKLTIYSILVWSAAFIPTLMAAVFEFVPQIPNNFLLKANFTEASNGPNAVVNMYFFLIPAFTLLCNNLLFVLTTYNIIKVQRSTKLAVKNQESLMRKKYFLFLRLYLFMGAPWFFGTVLACLNKLVVLKICRTLQPVLWLVMLASRRKIREQLTKRFRCKKTSEVNTTGLNETVKSRSKDEPMTVMKY